MSRVLSYLTGLAAGQVPIVAVVASPAAAHGFGQRYDLPLPLGFYLAGAAAAVLFSFVVMALVGPRDGLSRDDWPRLKLLSAAVLSRAAPLGQLLRAAVVSLLLLVVVAGLWGSPDPFRNIAPTLVWVIWCVGLAFVSVVFGDLWAALNPWATLFDWIEAAFRHLAPAARQALLRPYPRWLGVWPAVFLLLAFFWLELVWDGGGDPRRLTAVVLAYSCVTWCGMLIFGKVAWLKGGEVFALVFSLFARFAPLYRDGRDGAFCLRPPVVGLQQSRAVGPSQFTLVLVLLSGVGFDGLKETPLWGAFWGWILAAARASGTASALAANGLDLFTLVSSAALILLPLAGGLLFLGCCGLVAATSGTRRNRDGRLDSQRTAGLFVLSLLPIAIGYHLAHYLSYLLVTGQWIIPLISDPFGWGWDLFGTAAYRVDIALIDARLAWNHAVIAIVLGHIAAVWLAHRMALACFGDRRAALRSQVPMLVLMIAYSIASLWIIAQPIIEVGS